MKLQQTWLSTLLIDLTILQLFANGWKECHLRSHHCETSNSSVVKFRCPSKGRFQLPGDNSKFYRCLDNESFGCICSCHKQKHFDSNQKACKSLNHSKWKRTGISIDVQSTLYQKYQNKSYTPKVIPFYKENETKMKSVNTYRNKTGDNIKNKTIPYILVHDEELSGPHRSKQQLTSTPGTRILEDDSLFPAWAIALIVLCVVIVMVGVILIMY